MMNREEIEQLLKTITTNRKPLTDEQKAVYTKQAEKWRGQTTWKMEPCPSVSHPGTTLFEPVSYTYFYLSDAREDDFNKKD